MSSFYPLIPRMTSNTTPSGIATCSSALNSNYAVYKAFDKTADVWASVYNTSTVNQQWIKYEFPNVVKVKKIKLTVNNDRYLHYKIKGSLTDSNYIELWDYNQTGAVSDKNHVYELANEVSIKYLKLEVVTFQDITGNPPQVIELQVYSEVNPNISFESNPLSFVVSDDVSLIANFKIKWQINLNYDSTFGTATAEWQGDNIVLTANLKTGAKFNGWYYNGTLLSTSNPYTFAPTQDMTIDVSMGYQYTYTLNYDSSLGSASITRDNANLNLLNLSATLNSNAQFKGWYVNSTQISTSLNATYTLLGNATIEARFDEVFDITDSVSGNGAISYTRGSDLNDVVFTVIPDANYHFVKYTVNGVDYTTTPLSLHLIEDITIVVYIEEDDKYHITASTTFQYGSIYISDNDVYAGTIVTLWARPFPDYVFDHWEDGSYDNPRSITVTENVTLVAVYQRLMDTNGIYQYRCFVKDQLDLTASPKAFMVVDTFTVKPDLMTNSTSTINVQELSSNVNIGDVIVLYDPMGTPLYNGVIKSIDDLKITCSQMQSFYKGTWIYNVYPSASLEEEIAYLLGQYAQGKIYGSTYTDGLVAQRLGGITIDYEGTTSASLPTDLDADGNEQYTQKDMEKFIYELYENYGIIFSFEINISGANYVHIKVPDYEPLKVGNNMFAIQDMLPMTTVEETNRLIVFAQDKTYRTTYVATKNGIVEEPSTTANRFDITNTKIVFSDDDLADLVSANLPDVMYNHKIEFSLIIKNFIYEFGDFRLGGGLEIYHGDDYYNSVLTGYEIQKASNQNITRVHFICGKVRTKLTQKLTLGSI